MIDQPAYRVVLADDVAALRRLIRLTLEGSGRFRVEAEAATGTEAIQKARETQPDLVLLDLSMPEMDGLEALPAVLHAAPNCRVAVFSGFNHVRMAPVALRLGASEYLEKGMEPDQLIQKLLAILEPASEAQSASQTPTANQAPGPPALPRVLVFEPDATMRGRLARMVTDPAGVGGIVVEASSLVEANEHLAETTFDVILVDPGTDGDPEYLLVEVLSRAPDVPVIAIVADEARARQAAKLGVEDSIVSTKLETGLLERSILYAIERRRNYQARASARDQALQVRRLKDLERAKAQFFNTAAHELGTPLTPIKVQLHLLKATGPETMNADQIKGLDIVDRNVDRLARLSKELLDVARLQAGHMQLEFLQTHLHQLIQETVDSFAPVAAEKGVNLRALAGPDGAVSADPKRLTQVLYNLVNNALKFTPSGGSVWIEHTETDRDEVVLVHDTGLGLTGDQIGRLFEPFSQVHEEKKALGTGLGLFVSRGIVQLHGGRIWCESPGPGRGATFAFTIPKAPPSATAATASAHRRGQVPARRAR